MGGFPDLHPFCCTSFSPEGTTPFMVGGGFGVEGLFWGVLFRVGWVSGGGRVLGWVLLGWGVGALAPDCTF